jgi:hypothetical protein
MYSGQMSFRANVFLGKHLMGKCLSGQTSNGQMSIWANVFLVFWANVFWANAEWTNVVSPSGMCIVHTWVSAWLALHGGQYVAFSMTVIRGGQNFGFSRF